ncbi:hypothetical protein BVC80_1543g42 [Macleaya cordata]|uniref:Meiosis-specific protein ASY3-like coiled-coil domain-containing protein n=1 Tax=Macleaya cordata TaxID=56857 RepID=A0A200R1R5_MACCD|nr:hypothetical protein BVC80_1543g42 [Macleaya cordata]
MKAETSKRGSEILASVAEDIKLQLQNVDSQIQRDIGKFTSLGKSKRKRLETRFQEQQERLKLIQDKFKEEINQHLQDSRSTLDDLEAYQIELKGNAEKQSMIADIFFSIPEPFFVSFYFLTSRWPTFKLDQIIQLIVSLVDTSQPPDE